MTVVAYGKTPLGQLLYDLVFVDRTDKWLARKHRLSIRAIRSFRENSTLDQLRKQVRRQAKKQGGKE